MASRKPPQQIVSALALAAALACANVASAQQVAVEAPPEPADKKPAAEPAPDKANDRAWETAPPDHRGGFAIGLSAAGGFGAANGFPNDATKIGRIDYYTESGIGFATGSSLWIGGALADWLNFGVGAGYSRIFSADTSSTTGLLLFHTDVFPLYPLGGPLRDLAAVFEFGLGFPQTVDAETEETLIDGTASYLLAGAAWEGIKAWKFRFGPMIAGHYMWSETVRRPLLLLGFRGTLYTEP